MKYCVVFLLMIFVLACSKEDESSPIKSNSGSGGGHQTTSCSTINASSTITHNGVNYRINAVSGSSNSIGIEVVNMTGPFTTSYSAGLLQLTNGSSCYETSSSTEGQPGFGKFFEYKNVPSWTISNSTVSKFKITLDGSVYAIQDLHLDQN